VALRGEVFDVSAARHFYGPGGGYEMFRGRDASRCLAKMSLEEADLDGPVDDLNFGERDQLNDWCAPFFHVFLRDAPPSRYMKFAHEKCYPVVGKVSAPDDGSAVVTRAELLARGTGNAAPRPGRVAAEHLIAIRGQIYDVGYGGVGFYGAGASYHLFCGKDASRALAKMSFKPEDVDRGWPDLDDLDAKDTKILDDWVALFKRKYPVVATLHETD